MSVEDFTEDRECPLCMEKLEIDDLHFYPCTCKYQVCRFCWHRIKTDENGLCPACRTPYPEDPVNFQPLTPSEMQQLRTEKKQKEKKRNVSESRKHLSAYRVLQRNLVYVLGLSSRIADPELLKSSLYFGKYGKVLKVAVGTLPSSQGHAPINTAYVTFSRVEDALKTILETNSLVFDGRMIKTSLGTTKYCSNFLRGMTCHKQECMYLHDVAPPELSFTKEDMHQGKHTEYERRLLEKMQMETEKSSSQNRNIVTGQPFELPEDDRNISPIIQEQENDNEDDKSDDVRSAQESGASEPESSFDADQGYDCPSPSAVLSNQELDSGGTTAVEENARISSSNSPAPYPVYEDDLGFDPLAESLKGLEELLQEEERRPLPQGQSTRQINFCSGGLDQQNEYEVFNTDIGELRERASIPGNSLPQNNGFNNYHSGFDPNQSGRSNYNVHENYYGHVPSDYYMYRPSQNYSPYLRQEQPTFSNTGQTMGRMSSTSSSQGMSTTQNTYNSRDAFKALLPNVNVSFVSSPTDLQTLFSSSPSSYAQSTNQYSQDNYRDLSDIGYQQNQRQQTSYDMNGGRPITSIPGMRWMVSPPPGFDNNRNHGQS